MISLNFFVLPSSLTPTHSLHVHFSYLSSKCAVGPSKDLQLLFLQSRFSSKRLSLADKPKKCAIKFIHATIFLMFTRTVRVIKIDQEPSVVFEPSGLKVFDSSLLK